MAVAAMLHHFAGGIKPSPWRVRGEASRGAAHDTIHSMSAPTDRPGETFVGPAGWSYEDWKGIFYP